MLQKILESFLLLFVEQENLVNIRVKKKINGFKAMDTERQRRLLVYIYKLCAITNVYLKIKLCR